jgi:hypothetical protein
MNYAWQERKKFAIPVGVGAFVLLLWYLLVLSPMNSGADRAVAQRKMEENNLRARLESGVPQPDTVARAEREEKRLRDEIKQIRAEAEFKVDEAFQLREGANAQEKFGRQRQEVSDFLKKQCFARGFPELDPRLGFPQSVKDLSDGVIAEWLIRLAMVRRICLEAMDSGVERLEMAEVIPDGAEHQEDPIIQEGRFLNRLTVKFKVTGTSSGILKLAHALQQKGGGYLALEALVIEKSNDPTRDLMKADAAVSALVVRPDGGVTPEVKR